MNNLEILDTLWGGIIYNLEIDLLLQDVYLYIKLESGNDVKFYNLKFKSVLDFHIKNQKTLPWYHAELTEVYYSKNELYSFEMILWDEVFTINILSKEFECNLIGKHPE